MSSGRLNKVSVAMVAAPAESIHDTPSSCYASCYLSIVWQILTEPVLAGLVGFQILCLETSGLGALELVRLRPLDMGLKWE